LVTRIKPKTNKGLKQIDATKQFKKKG